MLSTACTGSIETEEDIISPKYPQPSAVNTHCSWTVQAKAGKHVKLKGAKLHIGGPTRNCSLGSLKIYDGCGSERFLVEEICSSNFKPEKNYLSISWGSCLTVEFNSNYGRSNRFLLLKEETSGRDKLLRVCLFVCLFGRIRKILHFGANLIVDVWNNR